MVDKDKDVEVIVEMTPAQLGFPSGATVHELMQAMRERGLRTVSLAEMQRIYAARPVTKPVKPLGKRLDADPIVPGLFLNDHSVRESDLLQLRPREHDDNPADWMTPEELDREMMRDGDAMDGTPGASDQVDVNEIDFRNGRFDENGLVRCRHCGRTHQAQLAQEIDDMPAVWIE